MYIHSQSKLGESQSFPASFKLKNLKKIIKASLNNQLGVELRYKVRTAPIFRHISRGLEKHTSCMYGSSRSLYRYIYKYYIAIIQTCLCVHKFHFFSFSRCVWPASRQIIKKKVFRQWYTHTHTRVSITPRPKTCSLVSCSTRLLFLHSPCSFFLSVYPFADNMILCC